LNFNGKDEIMRKNPKDVVLCTNVDSCNLKNIHPALIMVPADLKTNHSNWESYKYVFMEQEMSASYWDHFLALPFSMKIKIRTHF
jgi:hypothetical protein